MGLPIQATVAANLGRNIPRKMQAKRRKWDWPPNGSPQQLAPEKWDFVRNSRPTLQVTGAVANPGWD